MLYMKATVVLIQRRDHTHSASGACAEVDFYDGSNQHKLSALSTLQAVSNHNTTRSGPQVATDSHVHSTCFVSQPNSSSTSLTMNELFEESELVFPCKGHRHSVPSVESGGLRVGVSGTDPKALVVYRPNPSGVEEISVQSGILHGHSSSVSSVAFSSDGKRIVSGSKDKIVRVWDSESGACLRTLSGHSSGVRTVAFSSDGKLVVSGSDDNTLRVWDSESGACVRTLTEHSSRVRSVAFSSDGRLIVSGSDDNTLRVWDCENGECIRTLCGHSSAVFCVAFNSERKRIVSGSYDTTVRVWDSESGECLRTLSEHFSAVYSVAFSSDGKRIVSGGYDTTVRVWDSETGTSICTLEGYFSSVNSVAFSSNGKWVVSGSDDSTLRVWDSISGACMCTLIGHSSSLNSVAASSNGTRIVSGSDDTTVRVWDIESCTHVCTLRGHSSFVNSIAVSSDATRIVSGSDDSTVRVWDSESGTCVCVLSGHSASVYRVAFTSDGKRIVSGSSDNTVWVWDLESGDAICTMTGSRAMCTEASNSDDKPVVAGIDAKNGLIVHSDFSEPHLISLEYPFSERTILFNGTDDMYRNVVVTYQARSGSLLIWASLSSSTERELIGLVDVHVDDDINIENISKVFATLDVYYNNIFDALTKNDAWSSLQYIVIRRPKCGFNTHSIPDWASLTSLRHFDVAYTSLQALPNELGQLPRIDFIDVRHCGVTILPSEWSVLRSRQPPFPSDGLRIDEQQASVLPRALRRKLGTVSATNVFLGYLSDLARKEKVTRLRMVTAGDAMHGKTFLARALSNKSNPSSEDSSKTPGSTVGVDMFGFSSSVQGIDPRTGDTSSTNYKVDIWDFAGHGEYFPLHSLLFSELVQYLLVLNAKVVNDGRSHVAHLRKWMMSIAARAPSGRVILVLAQSDRIPHWTESEHQRKSIAVQIAKQGYQQLVEAHSSNDSRLEIHCNVIVVDSRKPCFIVVGAPELSHPVEMSRGDICKYLVCSAIEYMSSQPLFQERLSASIPPSTKGVIAPVVPALYLHAMEGIARWRKDRKSWRDYASASFKWLLRLFVSKEGAAQTRDVMTFRELSKVLQEAGVGTGDEFERVMAVLQSWGVLFYYGTSSGEDYEWNMSHTDDSEAQTSHQPVVSAADTASQLVFVNPSVLIDVTAHLYVRHHKISLTEDTSDSRRIGLDALQEEAVQDNEDGIAIGIFKKYGIASQSVLEKVFRKVTADYKLSIAGVLDLIEAMQLVHKLDVHFPADVKQGRTLPTTVPVYIVPTLIPERQPKYAFPKPDGRHRGALYDFTLQFNSSGLSSLVTRWILQCKRILEPTCTRRGVMWNGGADVYGGEKTIARIEWLHSKRAHGDNHRLVSGETERVRLQAGPLEGESRDSPDVQGEMPTLMRVVFQELLRLVGGSGPCRGIKLEKLIIASPCGRESHEVEIDANSVLEMTGGTCVLIEDCEGCERERRSFKKCTFRLPFLDHAVSTVVPPTATDETEHVHGRFAQMLEECALRLVGDTVIPSQNLRQGNMCQKKVRTQGNNGGQPLAANECGTAEQGVYVQRLEDMIGVLRTEFAEMKRTVEQNAEVVSQIRDAVEYLKSELIALRNVVNAECDSDVPHLFVLLPDDLAWWKRFTSLNYLFSKPHRLYLLCESRNGPHIPDGHEGYRVREPHMFIKRYGRTISRVLKIVSGGLRLASYIPGSEVAWKVFGSLGKGIHKAFEDADTCHAIANAMENAAKYSGRTAKFIDSALSGAAPSTSSQSGSSGSGIQVGGSDGHAESRCWRRYVVGADDDQNRAGLLQTPVEWNLQVTQKDGRIHRLWLCRHCYDDAERTYETQINRRVGNCVNPDISNAMLFERL